MRDAVRVALLARPGAGADRLREALNAAGAQLVLEADPTTLEPATLAGANAESVVVLLDAAVEEALDRLDRVLHDPAIDVLYEESEVAAAREGWDAARWSRHLSAKLLRHGDVLPPGREVDGEPATPAPRSDAIRDFRRDLAGIEQRIASMGLVADEPPAPATADGPTPAEAAAPVADLSFDAPSFEAPTPPDAPATAAGVVLVFAGIGGPDAVRQFLGALPDAFPRPVLIHQRLDGGRHDRLVQQMARATSLPVHLAAEDEAVAPGHVYILPPGLGLSDAGGLRFAASADLLATLPSAESAVLMFSGSDSALVDAAMDHAQAGALVAGQAPEDCYDAAAADALVARGAQSGQPAELARRLAERWAA